MNKQTTNIEDVVFLAGYRIRTALELIAQVTAEECTGHADKFDVLCSAEVLLIDANNIVQSAIPAREPPTLQAAE